ncbi:MAG: hypothetical protein U0359_14695 [Byssovorax sp.]
MPPTPRPEPAARGNAATITVESPPCRKVLPAEPRQPGRPPRAGA